MPTITEVADQARAGLRAGQDKAVRTLARGYAEAIRSVAADLTRVYAVVEAGRRQGLEPTGPQLERLAEYRRLLATYRVALLDLAGQAAGAADQLTRDAARAAAQDAEDLVAAGTGRPGVAVPVREAATQVTAVTGEGPLLDLLTARAGQDVDRAAEVIRDGVLRGRSPYKVASDLRRITNGTFANAVTVARTEQLRAYREATRVAYQGNPEVNRWRWSARCTSRTCGYCWAQHGTVWDLDRPMPTHPSCMCTMLPDLPGVEYGPGGEDRLRDAGVDTVRKVLGPTVAEAWLDGAIHLGDLAEVRQHPQWGAVGRTRPLRQLLDADQVREYRAKAR